MDSDGLTRLYREHGEAVFAFLVSRTGDRALAEDLTGDVFERVLRARKPFDPRKGRETTWLFAIALNLVRDHARRQDTERRGLRDLPDAGTEAAPEHEEGIAARDAVRRALRTLSADERDVIALRFGADLTAPQIATVTGEKLTTIEGRLYRALRKLRDELGDRADTLTRS